MLFLTSLFSGSGGNSTLVRYGNTRLLIDAGLNCRRICTALSSVGEELSSVSAVFLTHEHSDHVSALPVLLKKHPVPVYLPRGTYDTLAREGYPTELLIPHPPRFSVTVGEIAVSSFETPHDASVSVGYRFSAGGETAALATDLGCVTDAVEEAFSGAETAVIECNHDENMLYMGSYPYELKRRILSDMGHLSNAACAEFACRLVGGGTKHILLAHISRENNTPELAYLTVRTALDKAGYQEGEDYTLAAAKPDKAVRIGEI